MSFFAQASERSTNLVPLTLCAKLINSVDLRSSPGVFSRYAHWQICLQIKDSSPSGLFISGFNQKTDAI
jgi:hypothetical protein